MEKSEVLDALKRLGHEVLVVDGHVYVDDRWDTELNGGPIPPDHELPPYLKKLRECEKLQELLSTYVVLHARQSYFTITMIALEKEICETIPKEILDRASNTITAGQHEIYENWIRETEKK